MMAGTAAGVGHNLRRRLSGRWRRFSIDHFARRNHPLRGDVPYITFTFDDFPRSALLNGGRILTEHGVRGTYFLSFKLLGTSSVSGPLALASDLETLLQEGHELGCHTYDHLDGSQTTTERFRRSVEANRVALVKSRLKAHFPVFAYPLNGPGLAIKRLVGSQFVSCRGGGQTYNHGQIDLNLLKAYFLDRRTRQGHAEIRELIELNAATKGWLIFATHDVDVPPSDYGCDPRDFESIVRLALQSGAKVLPMMQVCRELGVPCPVQAQ